MLTTRLRAGPRVTTVIFTFAVALAALTTVTWAQPLEQATTAFVALDDAGLSHAATSITSPTPIVVPDSGAGSPYPASLVVSGFQGTIGRLVVRLNSVSHGYPDDLDILLVGPGGQRVMLMSDAGTDLDLDQVHLTFQDGAPALPANAQIITGTYAPTDYASADTLPAPAPGRPYSASLAAFNGTDPNGTWSLFVADDGGSEAGSLYGFTLIITPQFDNTTPISVPPTGTSGTTDSLLTIAGVIAPITKITVSFHITHPYDNELDVFLIGPDGTTVELTSDNGDVGDNYGTGCAAGNRTVFDDNAVTLVTAGAAPFTGAFRPEQPLSAFVGKSGAAVNGTWTLRVVDDTNPFIGVLQCWSVAISRDENAFVQPPSGLTATSVLGNQVTLRWVAPGAGPAPTNYVLEGGMNPGETLASLPTGSANPILTFAAPTGAFYVRLRARAGPALSDVSNEIRLLVNLPITPSPPIQFLGNTSGSSVGLTWKNTFEGGAPTSLILDVTGAAVASIPLPLIDTISFAGVPSGNYALRLRAVNAGGVSAASDPVYLDFLDACSGAPEKPFNFLAYRIGNILHAIWEPNPSGFAATGFVVNVSGALTGGFPVAGRSVSGTAGPGTYNFSVAAINPCGISAPTAVQSITIP